MSKEKIIDIHFFGIKHEIFQFIITEQTAVNLVTNDFGIIEKRRKIIELEKTEEDENLFVPPLITYLKEHKKFYWDGYYYPELFEDNYKKIILDLFKKINLSENKILLLLNLENHILKNLVH